MIELIGLLLLAGTGLLLFGLLGHVRRSLIRKIGRALVVGLWIPVLGLWFLFSFAFPSGLEMCADLVGDSGYPSPRGTFTVTTFTRDCGATTSYDDMVPIVMLRDRWHPLTIQDRRIVPQTDWLGREIDDVVYRGEFIHYRWVSENHLRILLYADSPPGQRTERNGAQISYVRSKQTIPKQ